MYEGERAPVRLRDVLAFLFVLALLSYTCG